MAGPAVVLELFVDVLCPFGLLAVRRAREAIGELDLGAAGLRLRALPLLEEVEGYEKGRGSREEVCRAFAGRIRDASGLFGGAGFLVAAEALESGSVHLPSSLPALAAVKWAQAVEGEVAAFRLFVELASRWLEHGEDVGERGMLLAAAREVGIAAGELDGALAAPGAVRAVARDVRDARALGLSWTPVALCDGERLDGLVSADEYRELLVRRLAARAGGAGAWGLFGIGVGTGAPGSR